MCVTRLELMFERAEQRSTELERSYALLDCWKRRGDELLYSMIPQSVADRLRTEKNSLSTCQVRKSSEVYHWSQFFPCSCTKLINVVNYVGKVFDHHGLRPTGRNPLENLLLWNRYAHYRVHNISPLDSVLNQMDPDHIPKPYFLRTHFNIIFCV
jgi:hypothetical protein